MPEGATAAWRDERGGPCRRDGRWAGQSSTSRRASHTRQWSTVCLDQGLHGCAQCAEGEGWRWAGQGLQGGTGEGGCTHLRECQNGAITQPPGFNSNHNMSTVPSPPSPQPNTCRRLLPHSRTTSPRPGTTTRAVGQVSSPSPLPFPPPALPREGRPPPPPTSPSPTNSTLCEP